MFVAHFVAVGMADLLDPPQRRKLRLRVGRLQTDEVWGYSINAPVDADDTAFALRALRLLGPGDDERVQSGLRGLATFREQESGLYRTFKSGRGPIRLVMKGGDEANYQAHPEVNANVLSLLAEVGALEPEALRKLWRWHQSAGVSESFYYPSRLYTLFWLLPLVRRMFPRDRAVEVATQQVVAMQSDDGSWRRDPLETAMGLQLLSGGAGQAVRAASQRAEAWLIDRQERDGSWRPVEPVWIFPAPDGDHWRALDQDRLLTTAVVVGALRHMQPPSV